MQEARGSWALKGEVEGEFAQYWHDFLRARRFKITGDGEARGEGRMDEGTPQGSILSPVLWLIYIARILKEANKRVGRLTGQGTRSERKGIQRPHLTPRIMVVLRIVTEVGSILEETTAEFHLKWDYSKNSRVTAFLTDSHRNGRARPATARARDGLDGVWLSPGPA